ncbi:hypothetical protein Tco_0699816 [Tanacetum coccineum]
MQTQVSKIDIGKAVDNGLVVMESNRTESEVQDESSRSGNDTYADDADIRPIYYEVLMAETIDYSKQSLESKNILFKKTVSQFQKDFSTMKAHCIAVELKYQNQALKSGQHGQILNETSNKAKIKKGIKSSDSGKGFCNCCFKNDLRKLKGNSVHAIKYKMSKAKERCMAYFRSLHSHLQVLSKDDLKGTHIEHGFRRAFMSIFGQDVDTFTRTMLLNVDQLQKQLDKDKFQEDGSMTAFWVVNNQFQKFINSKFTLDYDSQMTDTKRQLLEHLNKTALSKDGTALLLRLLEQCFQNGVVERRNCTLPLSLLRLLERCFQINHHIDSWKDDVSHH